MPKRMSRPWHPRFLKYMDFIATHPNYKGLPIERKADGTYRWVVASESAVRQGRIDWCLAKARELGIENRPGVYADVMLAIHPTKWKVCQTCGREMSLYYHYPNATFVKSLNRRFGTEFTDCDHISDIWDELIRRGVRHRDIAAFLIEKGSLSLSPEDDKEDILNALEYACRKENKKCLGPGAMSNFPDRYDGFHTYNRCCRASQDKGRSRENLKSYTKDRRAYEYWSDGNIHAANPEKIGGIYRDALKQNMANFMYILWYILEHCPENGETFLTEAFLKPNLRYFDYSYTFSDLGEILSQTPRHFTERSQNEAARYQRIAIEAVYDYNDKDNRNPSPDLIFLEMDKLSRICEHINSGESAYSGKAAVQSLMADIQRRAIAFL